MLLKPGFTEIGLTLLSLGVLFSTTFNSIGRCAATP